MDHGRGGRCGRRGRVNIKHCQSGFGLRLNLLALCPDHIPRPARQGPAPRHKQTAFSCSLQSNRRPRPGLPVELESEFNAPAPLLFTARRILVTLSKLFQEHWRSYMTAPLRRSSMLGTSHGMNCVSVVLLSDTFRLAARARHAMSSHSSGRGPTDALMKP